MRSEDAVSRVKRALSVEMNDGAWFIWEKDEILKAQTEYGGIGLKFRCGIGEAPARLNRALQIGVDLGIGDPVTPDAILATTPYSIGDGSIFWKVYPIETMIAEKLHALVTLGDRNSRSKDIYDMNLFLPRANTELLKKAVKATFDFRSTAYPVALIETIRGLDHTVLRRG